jgi:prepilin-type N-terminal cleavage/methylation domain-containing protein
MRSKLNGFTIIELLVVIAVIGILTTISVVSFTRYQADARDSQRAQRASVISSALEKYYTTHGEYPSCSTMTSSTTSVTTALPGIDPTVLITPQAASGDTNSIDLCTNLTAGTTTDSFAYVGDGSAACSGNQSCLQYKLEYKQESTGTIVSIASKHNTNIATSGNITDLSGTANQFSSASLTWSAVSNASSYTLQVDNDSGFTSLFSTTYPTGTSATITGLTPGTVYYFRVAGNAPGSQGNWSNTLSLSIPHIATPGSPAAADNGTYPTSQLDFTWSAVSGAASYSVDYSTSSTFASGVTTVSGITGTSKSVTGLTAGTTLYFRVKAVAPDDVSSYTATVSATTIVPVPTGVAVVTNSATVFTESWNTVSVATSYTIQCSGDNATWGSGCQASITAPTTSYAYGGAQQGTIYYVRVQAVVGSATSAWSGSVSTITSVNTPGAPSVGASRPGAIKSSTSGGWFPGTVFLSGSGNYYYAVGTASAGCPSGSYPVYNMTAHYNVKPSGAPQDYATGSTTSGTWYAIQPLSGYNITFGANAYCQGPNAASGTSGTNSATAYNP